MSSSCPRQSPNKDHLYGLYDPDGEGCTFYKTAKERDEYAKKIIESYLDDGVWSDDVTSIFAFQVTHQATQVDTIEQKGELDEDGYDENGEHWPDDNVDCKCNYILREIPRIPATCKEVEQVGEIDELIPMVHIPAGEFLMGSPDDEPERCNNEGPQHLVRLEAFRMSRTVITQAQWRVVAGWSKVTMKLNPDPSYFKGNERPVERVNWFEAIEFCNRLSQRTGLTYTLPSEAQWEYACRAGTTTPFSFGETLTTELANFNGNYAYANGPKGMYREQTTPVGLFPANAWGLHDMHGNVWEWCMDGWHDNYEGAPEDGRPWRHKEEGDARLLRGGSWFLDPRGCRSAYRDGSHPDDCGDDWGFRVCCLPNP